MKEKHKQSIGQRIFSIIAKLFLLFVGLVVVGFCAIISPFILYHILVVSDARSLMPPIYPDSIEVISGENSYAGSCCLASFWLYCTDASTDELIEYFEPYVGEFRGSDGHYQAYNSSDNQFVASLSELSGFDGYGASFELLIIQDDERCTTSSAYIYRISYPAG
jgi:hypothetical protein